MIKINMVIIICIGVLFLFVGKANANCFDMTNNVGGDLQSITQVDSYVETERRALKDCTITIKNDNGTNLEVTFHDVSWLECAKIKVVKWFKDIF